MMTQRRVKRRWASQDVSTADLVSPGTEAQVNQDRKKTEARTRVMMVKQSKFPSPRQDGIIRKNSPSRDCQSSCGRRKSRGRVADVCLRVFRQLRCEVEME